MLVLSRKKNEIVCLGPSEKDMGQIVVVEVRGDMVRLGFDVPREWLVHRKEIWDAIQRVPGTSPVAEESLGDGE